MLSPTARAGEPETRFGLDNLLSAAPQVAETIRPSDGLEATELDTPARREMRQQRERGFREEASAAPASIPAQIDWHAVTQEAFRRHAPAPAAAIVENEEPPVSEPQRDPTRPRGARERLLSSLSENPLALAAKERLIPGVSDLGEFRAKSFAKDTSRPATSPEGLRRHDPLAGRANNGTHRPIGQSFTQGFTVP
jgi:hypothetical protein